MNRIDVSRCGTDVVIVTLHGEHDLSTKAELAEQLERLVRGDERVIVDLSEVEYIDSTVIDRLVQADALAREHGLRLTLQVGTANLARVLELIRMRDYLPCASSREEAIALARSGG
jgi:anti-anti-sigma factor